MNATPNAVADTGKHIYIIDDDKSVRTTLARGLAMFGYDTHMFAGAEEFLQSAVIFRPAVLLIDMRMPQTNGIELQARLQASGWRVPIIFISGESTIEQSITAMKQGAIDFLLKPFELNQLTTRISQAIQRDAMQLRRLERQHECRKLLDQLKPREIETFFCLAKGYSYKELMQALGISLPTAKQYRSAVMRKLRFASLAELIRFHEELTQESA